MLRVLAGCLVLASVVVALPAAGVLFPGPDEFGYSGIEIAPRLRDVRSSGSFVPLADDQLSPPLPIGFAFTFYGVTYTTFRISSNGFITLGPGIQSNGCCSGRPLPSSGSPNNLVAAWWEDFNAPRGNIRFQTLGVPGSRELVVGFYEVAHFSAGPAVTWEIVLHEGSDSIEIQCSACPSDGGVHATGIENANGTIGLQIALTTTSLPRSGWLLALNDAPDCSQATAVPDALWPPNGGFVEVGVQGVTDPNADPIEIRIDAVFQDESLDDPSTAIRNADAWGIGSETARLRAERSGTGDGRVYHVDFTARDGRGGACHGTVTVCVAHGRKGGCVDQGPLFDSTRPPSLGSSDPPAGGVDVPRTAWIRLELVEEKPSAAASARIRCEGRTVPSRSVALGGGVVVLNPDGELPAGSECLVGWSGSRGQEEFRFATSEDGGTETVLYDRLDPTSIAPFPDDYWLVEDPATASGKRIELVVGELGFSQLDAVIDSIESAISDRDGFSPAQAIVSGFSASLEPGLLPDDEFEALDPFTPVALYDMDPSSPGYGRRVPFDLRVRNDLATDGSIDHSLVVFPAITLREGGTYAFVLTRRLHAADDPGRPFGPSTFFQAVAGAPRAGESAEIARARESIEPVLDFLESVPDVPIPRDDVALAIRISIRSQAFDASDLVAIKEAYLAAPSPPLQIQSVQPFFGRRAAVVRGVVELPFYLGPGNFGTINRDPVTGKPLPVGTDSVPFVLTLPFQALSGPVPIVFYEHGHPGSPDEVLDPFNEFLDDAGYAIAGIHDVLNRRFPPDANIELFHLLFFRRLPLFDFQSYADMMGFLRAIQGLDQQSLLPLAAPDAVPEIDPTRILFRGISYGSHYSLAFLPFAPEITAAVSVVGAGRFFENTIHQVVIEDFTALVPGLRPRQLLLGLAALINDSDRQDSYFLARHLYRDPLAVAGLEATLPPNLLWIEGIGDSLVSNSGTRAAANELGIPTVRPLARPSPALEEVDPPLSENVAPGVTAGHFQYDPFATPSCRDVFRQFDGHFCPQIAFEAEAQTLHFFSTALDGAAEIIDPFTTPTFLGGPQLDPAEWRFGPSWKHPAP